MEGSSARHRPATVRYGGAPVIEVRVLVEPLEPGALPFRERLTILRGQRTILRMRAERSIPVSVESIARAEVLARSLKAAEVPA